MKTIPSDRAAKLGVAVSCFILAIAFGINPVCAGNIFDDNWTPPARKIPAKTSTTPAPRLPADTQPANQPVRRPIPGKLDQARSRDNLKQVFAADIQDTSVAGRRKLAAKLFDAVPKTADSPVDQYVLLGAAINAAKESGNLGQCVQVAEFLSQMFEVDGVAIKADAALNMNLRGASPADAADNAAAGLEVLDLLIGEDDFASASRLSRSLKGLSLADRSLAAMIQQKAKELDALRLEYDHFVQASEVLKTKPNDPAANLAVGRYSCFRRGDWAKVELLAKGSDADLKKAADDELSGPKSAKENELVGDGWWAVGEKQAEPMRSVVSLHSVSFYKVALTDATGLGRIKMEQRIAQMSTALDGVAVRPSDVLPKPAHVDLLKLVDPKLDALTGNWSVNKDTLVGEAKNQAKIEFPYAPPAEYDYRIDFSRQSGTSDLVLICYANGRQFEWILSCDGAGKTAAICYFNGNQTPYNETAKHADRWIVNGEKYSTVVKVRKDGVEAYLNDKLVTGLKTDYSNVGSKPFYALHDNDALGMLVLHSQVTVTSAEVTPITGEGRIIRQVGAVVPDEPKPDGRSVGNGAGRVASGQAAVAEIQSAFQALEEQSSDFIQGRSGLQGHPRFGAAFQKAQKDLANGLSTEAEKRGFADDLAQMQSKLDGFQNAGVQTAASKNMARELSQSITTLQGEIDAYKPG